MESSVRTIQMWVIDPAQLGNRDTEPGVITVEGILMLSQPAEAFAALTALGACD